MQGRQRRTSTGGLLWRRTVSNGREPRRVAPAESVWVLVTKLSLVTHILEALLRRVPVRRVKQVGCFEPTCVPWSKRLTLDTKPLLAAPSRHAPDRSRCHWFERLIQEPGRRR